MSALGWQFAFHYSTWIPRSEKSWWDSNTSLADNHTHTHTHTHTQTGSSMASSWMTCLKRQTCNSTSTSGRDQRHPPGKKWDKQPVWLSCSRQSCPCLLCHACVCALSPLALGCATLGAISPPLMFPQQTDIKVPCISRIKWSRIIWLKLDKSDAFFPEECNVNFTQQLCLDEATPLFPLPRSPGSAGCCPFWDCSCCPAFTRQLSKTLSVHISSLWTESPSRHSKATWQGTLGVPGTPAPGQPEGQQTWGLLFPNKLSPAGVSSLSSYWRSRSSLWLNESWQSIGRCLQFC